MIKGEQVQQELVLADSISMPIIAVGPDHSVLDVGLVCVEVSKKVKKVTISGRSRSCLIKIGHLEVFYLNF